MAFVDERVTKFKKWLNWLYMQFILNTTMYVMEPFERKIFVTVVLFVLTTAFYSTLIYLILPTYNLLKYVFFSGHQHRDLVSGFKLV